MKKVVAMMKTMDSKLLKWLSHQGLLEETVRDIVSGKDCIVILLDFMGLLDWSPELAFHILQNPFSAGDEALGLIVGSFLQNLIDESVTLPWLNSRVWIRFSHVPLPPISINEAIFTLRGQARINAGEVLNVFGVVYSVSGITYKVYKRVYSCKHCGAIHETLELGRKEEVPFCCINRDICEDISGRTEVPYQEIVLIPVPRTQIGNSMLIRPSLKISLYDDLTVKASVGDYLAVIGSSYSIASIPAVFTPDNYLFPEMKLLAINVSFHSGNILESPFYCIDQTFSAEISQQSAQISLEKLSSSLIVQNNSPVSIKFPKFCKLALLLSVISSNGVNYHHPRDNSITKGEDFQSNVHVLFTFKHHCPVAKRALLQASLISSRNVIHNINNKNILAKKRNNAKDSVEAELVEGGSLSLAHKGICFIDIFKGSLNRSSLSTLSTAMSNPVYYCSNTIRFRIQCGTVWGICYEPYTESGYGPKAVKDPSINSVVNKFDLVFCDMDECASPQLQFESTCEHSNKCSDSGKGCGKNNGNDGNHSAALSIEGLRRRLMQASELKEMQLPRSSIEFMEDYVSANRKTKSVFSFSDLCFAKLIRLASACARLFLRSEISEYPDAALAIYLYEYTLASKNERTTTLRRFLIGKWAAMINGNEISVDDELKTFYKQIIKHIDSWKNASVINMPREE